MLLTLAKKNIIFFCPAFSVRGNEKGNSVVTPACDVHCINVGLPCVDFKYNNQNVHGTVINHISLASQYIYICICICICMYVCVYIYVCIYMYKHTCMYVYLKFVHSGLSWYFYSSPHFWSLMITIKGWYIQATVISFLFFKIR